MTTIPFDVQCHKVGKTCRYTFSGFFRPDRGLVTEAGMYLMGEWQWSPMQQPQTFGRPPRYWSWRKFRFIQPPTPHTLTVTFTWTYHAI